MDINNNQIKTKKVLVDFQYKLKLRTAIYGFILYLLLTTPFAFKVLSYFFNNSNIIINSNTNQPTFIAHLIMAFIIFIFLFIF